MSTHRLMVSYPIAGVFGAIDMRDEALEAIVGYGADDAGSGFGMRDLGWMFEDDEDGAHSAYHAVQELYPEETDVVVCLVDMEDE